MERQGIPLIRITKAALLLAVTLVMPVQAQSPGSVTDFQLPPGNEAPPPPAAGPLDPEMPAPVKNIPVPTQQPEAAPPPVAPQAPPPLIVVPKSSDTPAASASPSQTAANASTPAAKSVTSSLREPVTSSRVPATDPLQLSSAPSGAPRKRAPAAAPTPARSLPWTWWLISGAVLTLLLAGIGWGLRRRRHSDDTEPAEEVEEPPLRLEEAPLPTPRTGASRPSLASSQIQLVFEPQCLTMALVNARLAYRLSLTNLCDDAIGPVNVACDIISAHTSLGDGQQLLFGEDMVEPKHQFGSLAAGETQSLTSELQLPIAAILPIRSGDASLFVPLARFRITVLDAGRPPMVSTRIFVIGESPEQTGKRLRPIRIDQGARTFSRISQREIEPSA